MAPQKSKARAHHPQQPPPPQSDYETDAPPPAVDVPLPPPRSNEELNLSVLRRIYPDLRAIEHVTPYAALYTFSLDTQQWEKLGVEGTLFLCRLAPSSLAPVRYSVAILNRRGLDNFYLELTSEDDMEFADPYVILQADDHVYGIWVFADPPPASTADCRTDTANKMMLAAEKARLSRAASEQTHPPASAAETAAESAAASAQAEPATSAPMGRQLSLRELFGQPRQQDATQPQVYTSIHSQQQAYTNAQPQQQAYINAQPQHQAYTPTLTPGTSQQDVLGQLFFNAKQNYNGFVS